MDIGVNNEQEVAALEIELQQLWQSFWMRPVLPASDASRANAGETTVVGAVSALFAFSDLQRFAVVQCCWFQHELLFKSNNLKENYSLYFFLLQFLRGIDCSSTDITFVVSDSIKDVWHLYMLLLETYG